MTGTEPLSLGDATSALAELADLGDLEDALRQDYPGARLDDIDEEAVRRALGRQAVDRTRVDDPSRPMYLSNLGNALRQRFARTGRVDQRRFQIRWIGRGCR